MSEVYEQYALKNPEECTAKRSFIPALRAEGLLFLVVSLVGEKLYFSMMHVLGVAGIGALLFPQQSLAIQADFVYEEPDKVEWNDHFSSIVRGFGVLYLLVGLGSFTIVMRPILLRDKSRTVAVIV